MPTYTEPLTKQEIMGPPRVRYREGGMEVEQDYYVEPYWGHGIFLRAALGTGTSWIPQLPQLVEIPKAHPAYPELFAVEAYVDAVHEESNNERPAFNGQNPNTAFTINTVLNTPPKIAGGARIKIVYRAIDEVDVSYNFTAQNLSVGASWQWADTSGDQTMIRNDGLALTRTVGKLQYLYKKYYCAEVPGQAIAQLQGKINCQEYRIPVYRFGNPNPVRFDTFKPETLLYVGAQTSTKINTEGLSYFEITHGFEVLMVYDYVAGDSAVGIDCATGNVTENDDGVSKRLDYVGWNRVWNPKRQVWVRPQVSLGGRGAYLFDRSISQTIANVPVVGFDLLTTPGAR